MSESSQMVPATIMGDQARNFHPDEQVMRVVDVQIAIQNAMNQRADESVAWRNIVLKKLDDVDSLVRWCSCNMMDIERYKLGAKAFWEVVHMIAEPPQRESERQSSEQRPDEHAYFADWLKKDAPLPSETTQQNMARHAWLAGVRFADQFPTASQPSESEESHLDDDAIDSFAASMKEKLAKKRAQGRGGWQGMSGEHLSALLHEHVGKGDPLGVGNFAMMLHQNGQQIKALESERILFPTALRQMWSGADVQNWLDAHIGIEVEKPSSKGSWDRYRQWKAAAASKSTQTVKPRSELLDLALNQGAVLTGKPDGSEPITVLFSIQAWRDFDKALGGGANPPGGLLQKAHAPKSGAQVDLTAESAKPFLLTPQQIQQAVQCLTAEMSFDGETVHLNNVNGCLCALERAVLNSPEMQSLQKDAQRLNDMFRAFGLKGLENLPGWPRAFWKTSAVDEMIENGVLRETFDEWMKVVKGEKND